MNINGFISAVAIISFSAILAIDVKAECSLSKDVVDLWKGGPNDILSPCLNGEELTFQEIKKDMRIGLDSLLFVSSKPKETLVGIEFDKKDFSAEFIDALTSVEYSPKYFDHPFYYWNMQVILTELKLILIVREGNVFYFRDFFVNDGIDVKYIDNLNIKGTVFFVRGNVSLTDDHRIPHERFGSFSVKGIWSDIPKKYRVTTMDHTVWELLKGIWGRP